MEFLSKILNAYKGYYTVTEDNVTAPFDAQADFKAHGERYMLVKAAKIADIDTNEFVYFKAENQLNSQKLADLAQAAWDAGVGRVEPYYGHKCTDITLIIAAEKVTEDAKQLAKKIKHYKSYKFSIYGYSHFKLAVKELSTNQIFTNRMGSDLKKLLLKIN